MPPATYLFVGQLILWRGAEVTTVGYLEHEAIGPFLRKISNLSPWFSLLEQSYTSVQRNPQNPLQLKYIGHTVLKCASQINYATQHQVDKAHMPYKKKTQYKGAINKK